MPEISIRFTVFIHNVNDNKYLGASLDGDAFVAAVDVAFVCIHDVAFVVAGGVHVALAHIYDAFDRLVGGNAYLK